MSLLAKVAAIKKALSLPPDMEAVTTLGGHGRMSGLECGVGDPPPVCSEVTCGLKKPPISARMC